MKQWENLSNSLQLREKICLFVPYFYSTWIVVYMVLICLSASVSAVSLPLSLCLCLSASVSLPLSLCSVSLLCPLLVSCLYLCSAIHTYVTMWLILTTSLIQIHTNLANSYAFYELPICMDDLHQTPPPKPNRHWGLDKS